MKELSDKGQEQVKSGFAGIVEAYKTGDREAVRRALRKHLHNLDPEATLEEHLAEAEGGEGKEDSSGRMG